MNEEFYTSKFTGEEIDSRLEKVNNIPKNLSDLNNDVGYVDEEDMSNIEKEIKSLNDKVDNAGQALTLAQQNETNIGAINLILNGNNNPDDDITDTVGLVARLEAVEDLIGEPSDEDKTMTMLTRLNALEELVTGGEGGEGEQDQTLLQKVNQDITDIDVAEDVPEGGYADEDVTDNSVPSTSAMVLHTRKHGDANYLSKVNDDTAEGKITFKAKQQFDQGFEVGQYKDGDFGTGGAINVDENGNSYLEVDYGKFRKKVTFNDLEIKSLKHVGGTVLLSPASATLAGVVSKADGFACYFRKTDGEGKSVKNEWQVGDQARCQSFDVDAQKQTYYWRLVVGVDYVQSNDYPSSDYHCILLSQTDCDTLSDEPTAGDEIVQFGHRTDKSRQSAILLSAYDINAKSAPCIIQYDGIDSYDLTDKEVQRWSPGNNVLKGKVTIEPDSEGLRNFAELPEVIKEVEDYSDGKILKPKQTS